MKSLEMICGKMFGNKDKFNMGDDVRSILYSWEDPAISGRNRELTHAPLGAYADAASAFTLWVNGQEVGYSEDSRLPASSMVIRTRL